MPASTIDIDRSLRARTAPKDPIIAAATADVKNPKVTTLPPAAKTPAQAAKSTGRRKSAAKPKTPKVEGSAKAPNRLTNTWPDAKGKDIAVGDTVRAADGHVIKVIGRWSKHLKDGGLVPMVTGKVVSGGTKDKDSRHNAVAAEAVHTKK